MITLFISHCWKDKKTDIALRIKNELRQMGYLVWLDVDHIDFGESIRDKVIEGIQQADLVLVLWSCAAAAESDGDISLEIETAYKLGKPILPCRIDTCNLNGHRLLAGRKYIDFYSASQVGNHWFAGTMVFLQHFINEICYKKLESELLNDNRMTQLRAKLNYLKIINSGFENLLYRKVQGYTGDDSSTGYLRESLDPMIQMIEKGFMDKSDEKILAFLKLAKQIAILYPSRDQDTLKKRMLLEACAIADPSIENRSIQLIKGMLEAQMKAGFI